MIDNITYILDEVKVSTSSNK